MQDEEPAPGSAGGAEVFYEGGGTVTRDERASSLQASSFLYLEVEG